MLALPVPTLRPLLGLTFSPPAPTAYWRRRPGSSKHVGHMYGDQKRSNSVQEFTRFLAPKENRGCIGSRTSDRAHDWFQEKRRATLIAGCIRAHASIISLALPTRFFLVPPSKSHFHVFTCRFAMSRKALSSPYQSTTPRSRVSVSAEGSSDLNDPEHPPRFSR